MPVVELYKDPFSWKQVRFTPNRNSHELRSVSKNNPFVCVGVCVYICVRPGIQSEDQNQFFTFKVRTFWQSEVKISVLALWLCALSSLFHNMGVGGYGRNPLFVRARHVQRCVKKMSSLWMCYTQICPRFECRDEHTIHTCVYCVLTLNARTGRGDRSCVQH